MARSLAGPDRVRHAGRRGMDPQVRSTSSLDNISTAVSLQLTKTPLMEPR